VINGRGLCNRHYYRWKHYGDPLVSKNRPRVRQPIYSFDARLCPTCGNKFDPGNSSVRIYCGKRCKPSGRIAGSVNNRRWVEKLGREDGWICWLCDSPIDPELYWPHLNAGSVDHVVHVSNGGTDERSNLRLAHLTCNVSRQNRRDEHQPM
jgi:5-methylcytosine-specific restriction endonuclease McrA